MNDPQEGLSIGELARQAGVPAPTLRSWEDRYGFPRPQRLAGGHRRYEEGDTARIREILRLRASGMSLQAAIGETAARLAEGERSVFAALRRRHPGLMPQELSKATLLALTRAMEDECCARAEHGALFAGFQQERFYRQSSERWKELARTARVVVIFADFGESSGPDAVPLTVRIPADAPLRREWFMVCAALDYPALISGWEFPGQKHVPDAQPALRGAVERRPASDQGRRADLPAARACVVAQSRPPPGRSSRRGAGHRFGRPAPRHRLVQPNGELLGQTE